MRGDYRRISARIRAGNAVRQCAPVRPSGRRHRQPPRIPESRRPPAHRRHRLCRNARARWRTSWKPPSACGHPLIYLAGRFRLHGRVRKPRAKASFAPAPRWWRPCRAPRVPQNRADAQPRQRRRLLRDGRPGLRSQFHLQLAHRAHRRDGRRIGRAGALSRSELEKYKGRAHAARSSQDSIAQNARRLRTLARRQLRRRARPLRRRDRSARIARGPELRAGSARCTAREPSRSRWRRS